MLDLLGPIGPPETQNAAPAATGSGVECDDILGDVGTDYNDVPVAKKETPVSPLDRQLIITRFANEYAKQQTRVGTTLRLFADLIDGTRATSKKSLPWLKLARFGDVPKLPGGSLRHDANLETIDGVEGDYDAGVVTLDEAAKRLRAANLAGILYTTPSHTPEAPRWRVLCPTSEALSPDERYALMARVNGALGGILAGESFTRSQSYYFGAVGKGEYHTVGLVEGRPVDMALEIVALDKGGGPYVDVEDLLAGIEPIQPVAPVADLDEDDDLEALLFESRVDRINAALAFVPADDRDEWLRIGMAINAASSGSERGFEVWEAWSQGSDKYDAKDQRKKWDSFGHRSGKTLGIGSLFDLAKAYGWNATLAEAPKPATPSRLTFLSPAQCESTPSRGYVLKGILAPGDVGCIFGAPGAGKSLISPHIGYAVAQGREAFGMRSKPGRVFYIAAEDPHGMRGRVTALKMKHGDAADFTLVEGVSDLLAEDSPDLAAMLEAIQTQRPALVFLDTLAMAFPGLEENSAEAMGRVVAVARGLAQWGAAVVLIHHDTKAEGKTPRGHSLLNGALDMAMHVSRDDVGVVRGNLTKNRNGSCDRDMAFIIETRTLGVDEDGDPITAALVGELAAGTAPRADKLSPSARAALDILTVLEADNARVSGDCPPLSGVSEQEWREACIAGRAVSGSEKEDTRRRMFTRACRDLAGQGRTIMLGDRVMVNKVNQINGFDDGGDGFDD
ncbi:AAA family ATPase [Brevundimonas faecalis]|uniref:AAA family ATPase n=1 Tax=Brevundimonas faecalis TaxID=947378 RepID=UPI0033944371